MSMEATDPDPPNPRSAGLHSPAVRDIELPPGRYRLAGFAPMTGLLLHKWIEVTDRNPPGRYGPADLPVATAMPHLARIEDAAGRAVWEEGR
jgi:hypothetical protein